jgi:hypothetical protein
LSAARLVSEKPMGFGIPSLNDTQHKQTGKLLPGRQVSAGSPTSLEAVPERCTSPCPNSGTRAVHRQLYGSRSPATKLEGHPGGIKMSVGPDSTVQRVGTMDGTKFGLTEQQRRHLQDFRCTPKGGINTDAPTGKPWGCGDSFPQVKMEHHCCFSHGRRLTPARHLVTWNLSRPPQRNQP